jgi:prevent-host-death family protein
MSMQVNLKEARDRLSQLVQAVEDGEQVTICKNGKPVVDLVPVRKTRRPTWRS